MAGGAYIRIKGGNIEIHAPGKVEHKAATHNLSGPTSMPFAMPYLPKTDGNYNLRFHMTNDYGIPYANTEYIAFFENGSTKTGKTDAEGYTEVFYSEESEEVLIHLNLLEGGDSDDQI